MNLYSKIFFILILISISACSSGIRYSSNIYSDSNLQKSNKYQNISSYQKPVATQHRSSDEETYSNTTKNNSSQKYKDVSKSVYNETYMAGDAKDETQNNIVTKAHGLASFYGPDFDGKQTASGEIFDMNELTAAHRTLPFGTKVQVRNLKNGRKVIVKINDRGPIPDDRIIDLSQAAANKLEMIDDGVVDVEITVISFPE